MEVVGYDNRFKWLDPALLAGIATHESSAGRYRFRSEPPYGGTAIFSVGIGQQLSSCLEECVAKGFTKYGACESAGVGVGAHARAHARLHAPGIANYFCWPHRLLP